MWVDTNAPRHAGDIFFYQSHGSLIDKLITMRTGSDIVHVGIAVDGENSIAAVSSGISQEKTTGQEHAVWRPHGDYDKFRLNGALVWIHKQVGLPYGYADIANQVLSLMSKSPILLDKSSDCSDLATKFLWVSGVPLPPDLIDTHLITPGGLHGVLDSLN